MPTEREIAAAEKAAKAAAPGMGGFSARAIVVAALSAAEQVRQAASPGAFEPFKPYPIETLPDDLHDDNVLASDKWSICEVLLWNDCQGWWQQGVSEYWTQTHQSEHGHMARFWSPLPHDPMTRAEILAERGEIICPGCDWAIKPGAPHNCRPSAAVIEMKARRRGAEDV